MAENISSNLCNETTYHDIFRYISEQEDRASVFVNALDDFCEILKRKGGKHILMDSLIRMIFPNIQEHSDLLMRVAFIDTLGTTSELIDYLRYIFRPKISFNGRSTLVPRARNLQDTKRSLK